MTAYFKGSSYAGVGASTGAITIDFNSTYFPSTAIPEKYDFLILAVQTANEAVATPSGWSKFTPVDPTYGVGTGTSGGVGSVQLNIFYRFCDDTFNSVTIADSGTHQIVSLLVFKGVDTTTPLQNAGTGSGLTVLTTPSTSVTFPNVAAALPNTLILYLLATGYSSTTPQFTIGTNSNFTSLTEVVDNSYTVGVGGGLSAVVGVKTTGGFAGGTLGTISNAALQVRAGLRLNSATAFTVAVTPVDLKSSLKYATVSSNKTGSIVTKVVEDFEATPLFGTMGTWVIEYGSISTTRVTLLTQGLWAWRFTKTSSASSNINSPTFDITNLIDFSFDYSISASPTLWDLNLVLPVKTGGSYTLPLLNMATTGVSKTINVAEVLNKLSDVSLYDLTNVYISFHSTSGVASGAYITLDNFTTRENRRGILLVDSALALTTTMGNVGAYLGRSINVSPAALVSTFSTVNLYLQRKLSANTLSLNTVTNSVNTTVGRRLSVEPLDLVSTTKDVTMFKGYGISVSSATITLTTKTAIVKRTARLPVTPLNLVLTANDTSTVLIVPTKAVTLTTSVPSLIIATAPTIIVPTKEIIVTKTAGFYFFYTINISGAFIPSTHVEDSRKLDADAYKDLFEIALANNQGTLYLTMNKTVEWQGNVYEGTGIKIDGVGSYADDQVSRPKLSIWNPEGVFSYLVDQGILEGATVTRLKVLKTDIDQNLPVFRKSKWKLSRVISLKKPIIACELRDMLDGQNFLTPGRMFIPPEFKTVSLS